MRTAVRALLCSALLTLPLLLPPSGTRAAEPAKGAASGAADAAADASGRLRLHRPGEEVLLDQCLRFAVLDILDRNGPLEAQDWVTIRVHNACNEPRRHMLVDLVLRDVLGKAYGAHLWVLQRGEVLWPGQTKMERYAVPDREDHMPREWAVRLRKVEKPTHKPQPRASARR